MENKKYHVVEFSGDFGHIKPFSAVRDELTFSQSFLTPSILNGIEQKLFPEKINQKRVSSIFAHKLQHSGISIQEETTKAKKIKGKESFSVIKRGVLLNPVLIIAFNEKEYAERAFSQHICLTRNEDVLYPTKKYEVSEEEFKTLLGISFVEDKNGIFVGYDRFKNLEKMYINLVIK
jgi:hypothetical protein